MFLLYNLGILLYNLLVAIVSPWNTKAKQWRDGRKNLFKRMAESISAGDRVVWIHVASLGEFEQGRPIIEKIRKARLGGFSHFMVVVAEGAMPADQVAAIIKEATDLDPRVTVLGHIQRGGDPTARDRVAATKMGYLAVELLTQGLSNRIVCTHEGGFTHVDMDEGLAATKKMQEIEMDVLAAMTGL